MAGLAVLCPGQVYETSITVKDQDSEPSPPALVITKPDGTNVAPAPVPSSWAQAGRDYTATYDYLLPSAGTYRLAWSTTSPGTAPPPDEITVRDFVSIISQAEAKQHLNITTTTDDDELAAFMMAATELVESKAGHTARRQVTSRVRRDGAYLRLPRRPVLAVTSVTSIWAGGPSYATAGLLVDGDAARVYLADGTGFSGGPWDVAYTVGRAVPLEAHLQACKELLRHLWETQRGAMPPALLQQGEETYTTSFGMTFTYPRRVMEAIGPEPFLVA